MGNANYVPGADPIFIMGCQRSGTTLVSQILGSHPRVAFYHESFFYHILFNELKYYGDLGRDDNLQRIVRDIAGVVAKQSRELSNPGEVFMPAPAEIMQQVGTRDFPGVVRAVLKLYAQAQGKVRYGDKTPGNYQYLKSIRADFPDSPVIFIFRDPRDTILSSQQILGSNLEQAAKMWNDAYRSYSENAGPLILVRYEDLVTQPQQVVGDLCKSIDEPYSDALMSFFEHIPERFLARRRKLGLVGSPISDSSIGKFRDMKPASIQLIEAYCARGMAELGYEPSQPHLEGVSLPQRSAVANKLRFLIERLRYYGVNPERWTHGWARWEVMLGLRWRYYLERLMTFRHRRKSA